MLPVAVLPTVEEPLFAGGFAAGLDGVISVGDWFDVEDLGAGAALVVVLLEGFGFDVEAGGRVSLNT